MRRIVIAAAAASGLLVLEAGAQTGGSCASDRAEPASVRGSHTLPRGAAIVLDLGDSPLDEARLVSGMAPHSLEVEVIADGLVLLRPPEGLAAGEYELEGVTIPHDGRHDRPFTITDDALPEPPPAPRLSRLSRVEEHDSGSMGETDYRIALEATLRGEHPDGVVALLGRWTADDGERTEWAGLTGDPITLASLVPCAGRGEVPTTGTRMRFRYVDRYGQLSAETSARRVR